MNKKLIALLLAGILAAAAMTACTAGGNGTETGDGTRDPNESYIVVGTDADGNTVTRVEIPTVEPENPANDPSEDNPTFVDVSKKVVVFTYAATVRSSTVVAENNGVGWPSEGRVLDVTGESTNWYRINYNDQVCYIVKTAVADAAVLDTFTEVNEEVVVSVNAVNVRSYPSTEGDNIRGSLKKGATVTRIGISDKWSCILFEVPSEKETDENGNPKMETKHYYVSNDCITLPGETTGAAN